MRLLSVEAEGLKGPEFHHQLSEATAIIGPNAVGKTRILQAIRLVLAGWLPECGKTPRATWELASGPELTVTGVFDEGPSIYRRFWLDGATVKTESVVSNCTAQQAAAIRNLEKLPLLNNEEYFGLTDNDRTVYVFERIKLPDSYTPAAIISECERISFGEEHTEQIQKAKAGLIRDVAEAFESPDVRGGDPSASSVKPSIQQSLADAIDTFRERFTYWNRRAKETIGAVKTLTELKLREQECSTDTIKDLDRQMAEKQREMDDLNGKKGQLTAQRDEAHRTKTRIKEIRERLDDDRTDYPRMIASIDAKIKAEEAKRIAFTTDGETLRGQLVEARAKHRQLADAYAGRRKQIDEATQALEDLEDATDCPYCHSKSKGWKDKLNVELQGKIDPLTEEQQAAKQELEMLDAKIITTEQAIADFDEAVRINSAAAAEITNLLKQRGTHQEAAIKDEKRRTELGDELSGLTVIPTEKDLGPEIAKMEATRLETAKALSALNGRRTSAVQLGQDLKRAAQAELEHQDAAAHVLVIKAIANLLKDKREAMICEAFTGLLGIANQLTKEILKAPLALHENTIGMWIGSKFVPHRVFSGTEKALAYIAIAVALSSTAPLKLVILDEFGRLDEENQMKVLLRLSLLQLDGVIDQFIVVGTSLPKALKSSTEASQVHLEVIKVKS